MYDKAMSSENSRLYKVSKNEKNIQGVRKKAERFELLKNIMLIYAIVKQ